MENLIDIHSHIIPGVDDGSKSLEESIKILKLSYMGGVRKMILTPHFRLGMFETDGDTIKSGFLELQGQVKELIPGLSLFLGCEFHACSTQKELLRTHPRFFMNGTRFLLLEFSEGDSESLIKDRIYSAQSLGAKVIIAHVERYSALRKMAFVEDLKRMGAEIQVNADAVIGWDGFSSKQFTARLIREGQVDYIASDAHNIHRRKTHLPECADYVAKKFGEKTAEKLFINNPLKIISEK